VAEAIVPRDAALLARIFPVLGRVPAVSRARRHQEEDPQRQRTRGFVALREFLERLSDRYTVALFLDDLQWVDTDTLALLADVMRAAEPPPVLLVLASREEGRAAVDDLLRHLDTVIDRIELAPLGRIEAAELTALLLGDQAPAVVVDRITDESAGNPFFLG